MSTAYEPTWADVLEEFAAEPETARRLVGQLRACEISALAFCRLLENWARGEAKPSSPGERQAAIRRAADRVETALAGLEEPLKRYLLELEAEVLEGRSWYGGPGAAELIDWEPVLDPRRRAHAAGARRAGVPRARRARARARGPDAPRRDSTRRPTARPSGRGSSTCATTCSARRSRTCASSRARNLPLRWLPV